MAKDFLSRINWVDIFVIIILIRAAYIGFRKGFGLEIFKFLGVITALLISLHNYGRVGRYIANHSFFSEAISNFLAFMTLIIVVVIGFKLIRLIVRSLAKIEFAQPLEKFGGTLLGLTRGAILASLILFALVDLPSKYVKESINEKSISGPKLLKLAPAIYNGAVRFYPLSSFRAD